MKMKRVKITLLLFLMIIIGEILVIAEVYGLTMDDLKKAAEQGNTKAQVELGALYENGFGVSQDCLEAARWYIKAIIKRNKESEEADTRLSVLCKKPEVSKKIFLEADKGDPDFQYLRGRMYSSGEGVTMNSEEAAMWFLKAAEQGHVEAQYKLAMKYTSDFNMTREDKMKTSAKWMRKAAERGHPLAQGMLGIMYLHGEGVPKDGNEAVKWLTKAAEQELVSAQGMLGEIYEYGRGVPKDNVIAYMWYIIASTNGYGAGMFEKPWAQLEKSLIEKDMAEAQKLANMWLKKHKMK